MQGCSSQRSKMICLPKQIVDLHFPLTVVPSGRSCVLAFYYHYNTWLKALSFFSALAVQTHFLQVIAAGKWLKLEKTTYVDPAGNSRYASFSARWPFFFPSAIQFKISLHILSAPKPESGRPRRGRRGKSTRHVTVSTWAVNFGFGLELLQGGSLSLALPAGVGIIALLKRTLHKDCVVMVKQFRPPLGCYTLEFPAGQMFKCCFAIQPSSKTIGIQRLFKATHLFNENILLRADGWGGKRRSGGATGA